MLVIGETTPTPEHPERMRIVYLAEEEFRALCRLCREMKGESHDNLLDFGRDAPHLSNYNIAEPIQAVYAFATAKHHVNQLLDIVVSADKQLTLSEESSE